MGKWKDRCRILIAKIKKKLEGDAMEVFLKHYTHWLEQEG